MAVAGTGTPWGSTIFRVVLLSTLVGVLGVTLVSPVLPAVARVFEVSDGDASLVITAYTLPGFLLAPLVGPLADRYGRRRVLVGSLCCFGTAGAAAAVAPTLPALLGLRLVQGVGAAGIFSVTVVLIGDVFRGTQRTAALGVNAAAISVGASVYPLVGGALAGFGWRAPFALYPLGLAAGVGTWVVLPEPDRARTTGGLSSLRGALGALPAGIAVALYGALVVAFVLFFGAVLTGVPFLLSRQFGVSPLLIGGVLTAGSLTTATAAASAGRLAARFGPYGLVVAGFGCYGVALLGMWAAGSPDLVAVATLVFGAGQGVVFPSVDTLLIDAAPDRLRAGVLGIRTSVVSLGATAGPLAFAAAGGRIGYRPVLLVAALGALSAGFAWVRLTR